MGYGHVVYFCSMMVGVLLFSIGGLFLVWHGSHSLVHPEPVKYLLPSLNVLLVAMVLEAVSLRGALQALAAERGIRAFGDGSVKHGNPNSWLLLAKTSTSAIKNVSVNNVYVQFYFSERHD